MGIELDILTNIQRTIDVDYFGNRVNITYRVGILTPARELELAQARERAERQGDARAQQEQTEQTAKQLQDVLVHWDVVRQGEPVEPTMENLMKFPSALLLHIIAAIGDDQRPKVMNGRR